MKKFKSAITKFVVGALVVTGLTAGGTVAMAPAANAATQSCRYVDAGYGRTIGGSPWPGYRYGVLCYVDYSWWEEVSWPWPRDQYFWQVWQNNYCAYPARTYPGVSC